MSTGPPLVAPERIDYEGTDQFLEDFHERGWTDGLPVVPPTPHEVEAFLAGAGLEPLDVLGEVATREVVVTAEQVAINAVMAGCKATYFPVVVAAVRAHLSPLGNSHCVTGSLAGPAQVIVVNGPARHEIGIHSGPGCFGPGFRANATIGRALRLVVRNALLSVPGTLDRAVFSTPGRYSFCFGEDEETGSPWLPLHVQHGHSPATSTVTVLSTWDTVRVQSGARNPASIVDELAARIRLASPLLGDRFIGDAAAFPVVFGMEHRAVMHEAGWSKQDIQEELHQRLSSAATSARDRPAVLSDPSRLLIIAAGGPGIPESHVLLPHLAAPIMEVV